MSENRYETVSHDSVSRGRESEWRRYHFAAGRESHRRYDILQCEVAVGVKCHMGTVQIFLKLSLELPMLNPHIGQPVTVP